MKKAFRTGDIGAMAEVIGRSPQWLRLIILGQRRADQAMAERLVKAAKIEGIDTTILDWMWPEMSGNPAFLAYREHRVRGVKKCGLDFSK